MIRVLGPILTGKGAEQAPTGRTRELLCWLVMHANEPVPEPTLHHRLWRSGLPSRARRELATLVAQARRCITDGEIDTSGHAVRLVIDSRLLDVAQFESLVAPNDVDNDHTRIVDLTIALGLWRGEPYMSIADHPDATAEVRRLYELRASAEEDLHACRLRVEPEVDHELVADLRALVAAHPERTRAWMLLATGLNRVGRRVEAMRVLGDLRRHHPGWHDPSLVQLEAAILDGDPTA